MCILMGQRPIAYAFSTLTPREQNYMQLEKKALSLMFDMQMFNLYLYD